MSMIKPFLRPMLQLIVRGFLHIPGTPLFDWLSLDGGNKYLDVGGGKYLKL